MRRKIGAYLAALAREGYAASTIRSRREALAVFEAAGFSTGRFRKRLSRGPHRARQELSHLRDFLLFAGRDKEAGAIRLPRAPTPLPRRPPSLEEVRRLLVSLDGRTPISLRDRALAELAYSSGLRACEVARLKLEDVDFVERTLRVRGKGGRERVVPFGRPAAEWLMKCLSESRPFLGPRDEAHSWGSGGRRWGCRGSGRASGRSRRTRCGGALPGAGDEPEGDPGAAGARGPPEHGAVHGVRPGGAEAGPGAAASAGPDDPENAALPRREEMI